MYRNEEEYEFFTNSEWKTKCKCGDIIPEPRVELGYKQCVQCSTVEQYGCAPLINHKTGNSIQIMSSQDAARIAKLTQRRGYGTMLGVIALLLTLTTSCSNKVLSAHGQENDYYYELMVDKINCENCDEID